MLGWVYVLSNEAMPGLVKIGHSASDPVSRALELDTTGVPSQFKVEYKGLYSGYSALEFAVHAHLQETRHRSNREFFRVSVIEAVQAIRELAPSPAKYGETIFNAEMPYDPQELDSLQGYCRECGVVIDVSLRECLRCGARNPAR